MTDKQRTENETKAKTQTDKPKKTKTISSRSKAGGTRRNRIKTLTLVVPYSQEYEQRTHRSRGRSSNLGICTFVAILLEQNERNPRHLKMTDHVMSQRIIDEYPKRDVIKKMVERQGNIGGTGKHHKYNMAYWRSLYNCGKLTGGKKPEVRSIRYNDIGEPANPRTGA